MKTNKQCSVNGCVHEVRAKGLCENHYRRMKRNGSPLIYKNQEWGEARTVRADGYIYITRNGKQVMEHRWLMEQHLGRSLTSDEVVHHRDGNVQNNSLDNLEVMSRSLHSYHHATKVRVNF